jgi:hypothetical protein
MKYSILKKGKGHLGLILQSRIGTGQRDSRLQRHKADGLTHDSLGLQESGTAVGKVLKMLKICSNEIRKAEFSSILGRIQSWERSNGSSLCVSSTKEWSGCLWENPDATVLSRIEGSRLIDGLDFNPSLQYEIGGGHSPSID